jgi:periplasmic mercuric ion binding protein
MRTLPFLAIAAALLWANPGLAAEKRVTLAVDHMTCESCPYIVKQSLKKVSGVSDVVVSFEKKTAVVTYDDGHASVDSLIAATTNAGFPAHIQQ